MQLICCKKKKCCKIINFAKQLTAARALFCKFTSQKKALCLFLKGSYCYVVTTDSVDASCFGSEVIKHFSCSTRLSTKFQLLIKARIQTNEEVSCFKSLRCCIYHAHKCLNANNF